MKRAQLLSVNIGTDVYNPQFKENARKRPQDFTRNRKMTFEELIFFILKSSKTSTPTAIRRFFKELEQDTTMTQQSVSEARAKLTVKSFEFLYRNSTVKPLVEVSDRTWNDYFVYAIDGSKIALPADKKLLEYYGAVGRGAKSPTAQGSILYDVLNDIVVDAAMEPISIDERTLALRHLEACKTIVDDKNILVIFDRGYPSFDLIKRLETDKFKYVMRVRSKFNLDIDAQTEQDGTVWIEKDGSKIQVRVIKVELDSGEIETLITNIYDKELDVEAFKTLYFMRWPIETKYNLLKGKLQLENFTARTVEGVQQDFFAAMCLTNFIAAVEYDIKEKIKNNRKFNTYEYKVNKNELIGILKDHLIVTLAHDDPDERDKALVKILQQAQRNVIPIRPNRRLERNPYTRKSRYHHNKKSNA
jgi:hypothetical protein